MVIIATCQALPRPQEPTKDIIDDEIVHDEAKETAYEDLRDHDLQESLNAGQSGLALELISHGENPANLWRPKRQEPVMADHLEVPETAEATEEAIEDAPAPIDDAYAARLEGSLIAYANKLANAKRQKIERVPGYGRKKRQISEIQATQEVFEVQNIDNTIDDTKFVNVVPQIKIKNWGEIGITHPLNNA